MNLYRLKILLIRHSLLIFCFPLLVAVLVFFIVRNQPQEYTSYALLYTGFASGYDLESTEGGSSNTFGVNSAFDNLISTVKLKSTLEEVSIELLAHYLTSPEGLGTSFPAEDSLFFKNTLPADFTSKFTKGENTENVKIELTKLLKENDYNLTQVVHSNHSPIGVSTLLNNLDAYRVKNSDILEVFYKSTDAKRAQITLNILVLTLIKRYKMAKVGEASSVVGYFENQLKNSAQLLKQKEDTLKMFSSDNEIVNAEEDSKAVAALRKSIENSIDEETSALAASEAALNQLNTKLSKLKQAASLSVAINSIRDSLTTLNAQLLLLQNTSTANSASIISLQSKIQGLESELKEELIKLDASYNSQDGVPARLLLSTWVNTMLEADRSKARLKSLQALKEKKLGEFQTVVPLGVELNRLKREITLAEKNYLGILDNLNASRLREQNISVASNLRILDEPSLPNKPESSKKNILILLGGMAGFMLVMGFITGKELLDSTIKFPYQCQERLHVPFAGALPDTTTEYAYTGKVVSQLLHQCINSLKFPSINQSSPFVIVLFSTQPGDGKTYVGEKLARQLTSAGYKTMHVTSLGADAPEITSPYIKIVELPSLNQTLLPQHVLNQAHLSLLIVPANRKWSSADEHILNIYRMSISHPVYAFINRIEWTEVKRLLGILPTALQKVAGKKNMAASFAKRNVEESIPVKS
jgi:uncharacterized protein involved in exopolysaccharide biosynthesis